MKYVGAQPRVSGNRVDVHNHTFTSTGIDDNATATKITLQMHQLHLQIIY